MSNSWGDRVRDHLARLYPDADLSTLAARVTTAVGLEPEPEPAPLTGRWSESDIVLITYGDSIVDGSRPPLEVLAETARRLWSGQISIVHLLPFFPYSSDRGFAVIDHRVVDPQLGSWADVERLDENFDLMMDLVVNHVSSRSEWIRQYLADQPPGRDFFIAVEPGTDLSAVVRPRDLPLTHPFGTDAQTRHLWCTFSADQVDLDWSNPDVLVAMLETVDVLLAHGARFLRLDAIAFLWKEPGTKCIHLPQTHEVVRLFHTLLAARAPDVAIITETNVPSAENLSYFGSSSEPDEAHIVYNFPLPPLLLDALLQGRGSVIEAWIRDTGPAPQGRTLLNFLASHDGIGLRPAHGILTEADLDRLVELAHGAGGFHSSYSTPYGDRPYELNMSLWDAFAAMGAADEPADWQAARHLCAHAILLALAGVPAVYVNSLLALSGDRAGAETSGVRRDINRARIDATGLSTLLGRDDPRARAIRDLGHLMAVRREQPAFHPESRQEPLGLDPRLVTLRRSAPVQTIVAAHNVSTDSVTIDPMRLGPVGQPWVDVLTGRPIENPPILGPYAIVWWASSVPTSRGNSAM